MNSEKCFGCGREIADGEPRIHVGLDEWSSREGGEAFGLDDLLTFPFCEPCTVESPDGRWHFTDHARSPDA